MHWTLILGLIIPGLMTGVGAIPALFAKNVKRKGLDMMLGFSAGIMLAATGFSLIVPSIEAGGDNLFLAVLVTGAGIFCGMVLIDMVDRLAPHEHLLNERHEGMASDSLKKIWLFVIAITIHNIPEGMAVGVGFGSANVAHGLPIAVGIGLQNMPEGLAVAFALMRANYSTKTAFWIAALTGVIEPVMAFAGYGLVRLFQPALPFILALAAGAMLFVIVDEVIPETHGGGNERVSSYALILGFILMMVLDVTLG
jgi:ZIP family zinc transporter